MFLSVASIWWLDESVTSISNLNSDVDLQTEVKRSSVSANSYDKI